MVFQEPMTSLNPVYTVGEQIAEVVRLHENAGRKARDGPRHRDAQAGAHPAPEKRVQRLPHQFSGGMRQRVMIAMALSCNPKLLIADEPTTALDVTIQAQILDLMNDLKDRLGMAVMLITHAMGVVAETAQRVVVMYAARWSRSRVPSRLPLRPECFFVAYVAGPSFIPVHSHFPFSSLSAVYAYQTAFFSRIIFIICLSFETSYFFPISYFPPLYPTIYVAVHPPCPSLD
jgi:energy-coupling factor transporter ATP-binding protein EcfA2